MSSMLSSEGVVFAAMAAVSGTIILLAFRLHKSPNHYSSVNAISSDSQQLLRSSISAEDGERKEEKIKKKKKKKKKVHFADNVVDPTGNSKEYRKLPRQLQLVHNNNNNNLQDEEEEDDDCSVLCSSSSSSRNNNNNNTRKEKGMPANRAALYNGILRDRLLHRVAYSF